MLTASVIESYYFIIKFCLELKGFLVALDPLTYYETHTDGSYTPQERYVA